MIRFAACKNDSAFQKAGFCGMDDNLTLEMNDNLPLRDVVFNTLRKAILRGDLSPNERLMEMQLANRLGVSRTPVREAIRKLELEGLVVMLPRRGAKVAQITVKSIKDVLEIRRVLEVLAVTKACKNITDEEIGRLKTSFKDFKEIVGSDDLTKVAECDVEFHEIIYNATNNPKLIGILHNLREQMYRYRVEYIKDKTSHQMLVKEHEEMLNAIINRDAKMAGKIAVKHIDNQEESVMNSISE